jgi:hypothetical protein
MIKLRNTLLVVEYKHEMAQLLPLVLMDFHLAKAYQATQPM